MAWCRRSRPAVASAAVYASCAACLLPACLGYVLHASAKSSSLSPVGGTIGGIYIYIFIYIYIC